MKELHIDDELTKDEELELGRVIQENEKLLKDHNSGEIFLTDSEIAQITYEKDEAVELLVRNHINLARSIAYKYKKSTGTRYPIEDLIQDAISELVDVVYKYEPSRNCRLSTFAYQRIAKRVSTEINKQRIVRMPENKMGEWLQITRAQKAYSYLEDPEISEYDFIIQETGLEEVEVDIIMNNMRPTVSLNVTVADSDAELGDILDIDEPKDEELLSYEDLDDRLVDLIKDLDEKERDLLAFFTSTFTPSMKFEDFLVKYNMKEADVNREARRVIRKMKKAAKGDA